MALTIREQAYQAILDRACMLFGKSPGEIGENTRFIEDLGAKSSNVSQMTNYLEDIFDVEIPFMKFRRATTIGLAADLISELVEE
jgi:acyl carrier protein